MKNKLNRLATAAVAAVFLFGNALPGVALAVDPAAPLPIEVVTDATGEVRKVYELSKAVDPATLPVGDIERGGVVYECVDVLRTEIAQEDTKPYEEAFETESKSNDDASLAAVVPAARTVETEDGYIGELTLVPGSVIATVKGFGSSSSTRTATRTYPGLSDMDTSQVPKTTEEGGRTLSLVDVKWQTASPSNPDDPELEASYTAVAYYSVDVTNTYATGYTVTAKYAGNVTRPRDAMLRYTVIFAAKTVAVSTNSASDDASTAAAVDATATDTTASSTAPTERTATGGVFVGIVAGICIAILIGSLAYIIIVKKPLGTVRRTHSMQGGDIRAETPEKEETNYPGM